MRATFDAGDLDALKTRQPATIVALAALNWATIVAAWALALWGGPAFWIVAFVVIGARQHELSVWVHEGSHGHLHRDPRLNDRLTNWLFAGPIGITVASYRSRHRLHHDHLGQPEDSERHARVCIRDHRLWRQLLLSLSGLYAIRLLLAYNDSRHRDRAGTLVIVATQAILAAGLFALHPLLYPLLWVAPLFTVAVTLTALRAIAEHQPPGLDAEVPDDAAIGAWTRSIDSSPLERWFIAPLSFNRHLEHEEFEGVPFYHLDTAHRLLRESGRLDEPDRWHRGSYMTLLFGLSKGAPR